MKSSCLKRVIVGSVTIFISCYLSGSNPENDIDQEIQKELRGSYGKQKGYTQPFRRSKLEKHIDGQVKKEIKLQTRREHRQETKDRLAGRVRTKRVATKHGKDFIYKIPTWPFSSIFYAEKDTLEIGFEANDATKAYSSGGSSQDMSKLIFGERQITVKDVLLASKLLKSGDIQAIGATNEAGAPDDNSHYFYLLADQPLDFDASMNSQKISIKYARHFMDGDISFGLDVPVVRRENKIRLSSTISRTTVGISWNGAARSLSQSLSFIALMKLHFYPVMGMAL